MAESTAEELEQYDVTFHPSNFTNSELQDEVDAVDDVGKLEDLLELEEQNQDRSGAKSAINSRIELVEEEQAEQNEQTTEDGEETNMSTVETVEVDPEELTISETNERAGNAEADDDLIKSVSSRGIDPRQRPLARPDGDDGYEVIYGQRRVDAAIQAPSIETIEVNVQDLNDAEARQESIRENYSRGLGEEVSSEDRSIALLNMWEDMGNDGFPSSSEVGQIVGASKQTTRLWLEPLREEWEGTAVDPRTDEKKFEIGDVGETSLSIIRNIPNTEPEMKVKLANGVAEGDETQSSLRDLQAAVEEGRANVPEYLDFGQSAIDPPETDEDEEEATEGPESVPEPEQEEEGESPSEEDETDSEATEAPSEDSDEVTVGSGEEEEQVDPIQVTFEPTYAETLEKAAEAAGVDRGELVNNYIQEGLERDGYDL